MRKAALLLGVAAGLLVTEGLAAASDPIILPTGQEGCVSQAGDTCTYNSTRSAGYAANGEWTITVEIPANGDTRDTNLDGFLRYVFTPANAPQQGCGFIDPGSRVTSAATSGGVAVGNPFPGAADGATGDTNDCPTGAVSASNPNYTPVD